MDAEGLLRLKIRLLTEGATLPESEYSGRKGGAGPSGARYYLLENGRPCGVPIREGKQAERYGSPRLQSTDNPDSWLFDSSSELLLVPKPKFYDLTTSDGVPYYKIALLHGVDTLATTLYQSCRYWDHGSQCKFCTIPFSYTAGNTVLEKTPEQLAEVVQAAEREGVIKNVLITTGTPDTDDAGCEALVSVVRAIRQVSSLPIGVQLEPPLDLDWLQKLHDAGVEAVGMHIETADESLREEFCPGKFDYASIEKYREAWIQGVDIFGRGNVSTFLLQGLGEDYTETLALVEELSEIGVLAVVAPLRPAPSSQIADHIPPYVGTLEESIRFYEDIGKILYRWNLNPQDTLAGCHSCGGCTPIQEAYDWAMAQTQ